MRLPSNVILAGLYKSKWQDSVQLQTVLASYDQETVRNSRQTSYLRLKASVKLHTDQMMRTRNFRVPSEVLECEQSPRVKKERKPTLRGKCESLFSGRHMDNVFKEDSCSFSHDTIASGNSGAWISTNRKI